MTLHATPEERASVVPVAGDWVLAPRHPGCPRRQDQRDPGGSERWARALRGESATAAEAELTRCVRAAAPTRRVLCALASRALDMESWSRLGFARCGDQARERQGVSARSLQELARVHRVLESAPRVDAAFRAGRIGWTAARALARLGRIDDEAEWLERARTLSLSGLERAVRQARARRDGAERPVSEDPEHDRYDCVPLTCVRPVRAKWSLGRELARRVAGGRLPSWECAEVVAAEVSSAVSIGGQTRHDLDEPLRRGACLGDCVHGSRGPGKAEGAERQRAEPEPEPVESAARRADRAAPPRGLATDVPPLGPELARLLDGLDEADAFALDRRLREALRLERTHEARIGPLLRRVLEARAYRWRGYWDRDRYLEEHLGLCARKARALVRIERVLERSSALGAAYRSGRLSWVQTQALAPLVEAGVPGSRMGAWAERARRITVRRLQDDVRGALALADLDPAAFARTGGVPEEGEVVGNRQTGARADEVAGDPLGGADSRPERQTGARRGATEEVTVSIPAPPASARFFRAVLEEVRERLAVARDEPVSEGEAFEAMLDHAIGVWSERSGRSRRELCILERDGWRCVVPGCTSPRNLQVHHVVFRSQGGGDEPENLVSLCAWHHQRGVHGGTVRISGRAPHQLRFELGLRPGRPPLVVYESGDRIVG